MLFIFVVVVIGLLLMITVMPLSDSVLTTINKLNVGALFKREQNVWIATDNWLHTISFQLPPQQLVEIHDSALMGLLSSNNTMARAVAKTVFSQRQHLHYFVHDIRTLVPTVDYFRKRRGLCNFCGSILGTAFGVATRHDVARATSAVRHLQKVMHRGFINSQ